MFNVLYLYLLKYVFLFISLLFFSFSVYADDDFHLWLDEFKTYAKKQGVKDYIINDAFQDIKAPVKQIIKQDRQQPEFITDYWDYVSKRVTQHRIKRGLTMLDTHRDLLQKLQDKYGVPAHYLIALWGIETNFGDYLGNIRVIDALTSLAYDKKRRAFFSKQLLVFLQLSQQYSWQPRSVKGSWAGAMGHMQFIPSTFYHYAIDGNNDNKIDIWHSVEDALSSAANYLHKIGWKKGRLWGRDVILSKNFPYQDAVLKYKKPLSYWHKLGIKTAQNKSITVYDDIDASIFLPLGIDGPAYMLYDNFYTIMKWNNSANYALSVTLLADVLAKRGNEKLYKKPKYHQPTRFHDVVAAQKFLNNNGYNAGKIDGIIGAKTRHAIRKFQQDHLLTNDGYINNTTLKFINSLIKS